MIKVDLLLENDVDATREFFLDQCTSDGRVLLPGLPLIEVFDLREILNGPDLGMTEGELQIAVAVFAATVPALTG